MINKSEFPMLEKLMAGYLNMDAVEMTGCNELKGMVEYYTTRVSKKSLYKLLSEIDMFVSLAKNLDEEFEIRFDFGLFLSNFFFQFIDFLYYWHYSFYFFLTVCFEYFSHFVLFLLSL